MALTYTRIPENTFKEIQFNAGIVLNTFDTTGATEVADADIICATTGGVQISATPSFTDLGEDVDNCPKNMMELKELEEWEVKISFTALSTSAEMIRWALGAADVSDGTVTPRASVELTDFQDIWWVGDMKGGGYAAAKIMNALSTGGFSLQTTDKGKGQFAVELTGHVSIDAQDVVPIEFYVSEGTSSTTEDTNE